MTVLKFRGATAIVFVSSVFLRISSGAAAECDLEKIFRTPKDMSDVNFDHFEIVERNGFDRSEDSDAAADNTLAGGGAPPASESSKSGRNVANALVSLRFGGDDVHGNNHIMKIPPQCRNVFVSKDRAPGYYHQQHHPPPYAYPPPPCPSHYYHPYPPPVPFSFPNYYFCHYGDEIRYLPPQLRHYFQRHRLSDFGSDEYRPARIRQTFREHPVSDTRPPRIVLTSPRILKPLNLSNEDIEEKLTTEKNDVKRDCSSEAESKSEENEIKIEKDATKETKKKHHKKSKKSKNKDNIPEAVENNLEKLLNQALIMYKCPNCSSPPKLLVSYPITHRDNHDHQTSPIILPASSCPECKKGEDAKKFNKDIDSLGFLDTENIKDECKCINCQCHKRHNAASSGKKFIHDVDDLVPINSNELHAAAAPPPPLVPIPQLTKMRLDEADARQKAIQFPPKPAYLFTGHNTLSDEASLSFYSQNGNSPPYIHHEDYAVSSGAGYKLDPHSFVIYREPTLGVSRQLFPKVKAAPSIPPSPPPPPPTTIIVTSEIPVTETYLPPTRPRAHQPLAVEDDIIVPRPYPSSPIPYPGCYFYPQAHHDSARREIERHHSSLPKYLKVIPRDDLQVVSPQDSDGRYGGVSQHQVALDDAAEEIYCRKCGQRHSGDDDDRHCFNCGVIVYAVPNDDVSEADYSIALPSGLNNPMGCPHVRHGPYCLRCPRETRQLNEW